MKTVIISGTTWLDQFPKTKRPQIIRMIFSLAASNGYQVVVKGQHWPK